MADGAATVPEAPAPAFSPPSRDGHQAAEVLGCRGRVFVVMGPPASGKGTQCRRLVDKYGLVHLSTGDIFRDLAGRGTELGLQAKEFLQQGCFVPDDLVLNLVRDRMGRADAQERGCVLDGFPRTAEQAQALLARGKVDGVFLLVVPEKTLVRRAADRRIDPDTGDIYHLKFIPPPAEVLGRLVRRDRDDDLSFRQRLEVFKGQQRRVLPYFSGQVWKIDATLEPQEIFDSITRIVDALLGKGEKGTPMPASTPAEPALELACSICFEEPADFLVLPCGHQCGCEDCLKAVQQHSGRCPICRSPVQGLQRVFRCGRSTQGDSRPSGPTAGMEVRAATHAGLEDRLDGCTRVTDKEEDEWSDAGAVDAEHADVSLTIAPCEDIHQQGGEHFVTVTVRAPDSTVRLPADICCVIDVSGSMGSLATFEGEDGKVRDDGMSVLDIVIHATKTVLHALEDGDRLAIVSFSSKGRTVLPLTHMTKAGQELALRALETLDPDGNTNIWDGVLCAMEALRTGDGNGRQQALLLLTDGQPNVNPPRGHLAELKNYKDTHPGFSFQLNTFGFGYNLDSDLLLDLAIAGNGTYAFIPDAVIVGTTFVNSVANVLTTLSQSATVSLMPQLGVQIAGPVLGDFVVQEESWGRAVDLGPLQYGQSRDLVVPLKFPPALVGTASSDDNAASPYLEVVLSYPTISGSTAKVVAGATALKATADAAVARCRGDLVGTGYAAIAAALKNNGKEAAEEVGKLAGRVNAAVSAVAVNPGEEGADSRVLAMKADVEGRMSKALKGKDRFNRWGKHYLRALMRSHQLQACTNFMDPGLQPYGGTMFRSLRQKGDTIFLSLPPPVPARRLSAPTGGARSRSPSPNMTTYYAGAGGGCFAPTCNVRLVLSQAEEKLVHLSEVRVGDRLRVADGGVALVRCLVRVARDSSKMLTLLPTGLQITGRHPVHVGGEWKRPMDLPGAQRVRSLAGCVYNLVLDRCHVLLVDGVACATWGHGLKGAIIEHGFFGTARVTEALKRLPGWEGGFVQVQGCWKDTSGKVVGFC